MILELFSSLFVFASLVLSSLIPYCLLTGGGSAGKASNSFVLSLCNCVACGIFLSTCFLGLIPHVRHHEGLLRNALYSKNSNSTMVDHAHMTDGEKHVFLNTELVVLAGFVLILLIEQAIFMCSSSGHGHSHGASPHRGRGEHRLLHMDGDADQPLVLHSFDEEETDDIVFRKETPSEHPSPPTHGAHHGHAHSIPLENGLTVRTLLLLLGLSIHSVFEGVALGLQKDKADFFRILIAIMLHEVLCCVAYGVSLAQQRAPRSSAVVSVIILSACIPAGMGAAFLVDILDSTHSLLLRFLLEGIAAGTFIYVAAVEMLPAELGHSHDKKGFLKALAVFFGVLVFFVLQQSFGGSHGAR